MTTIPLKFRTHLPDEDSLFDAVELTARIDILTSLKCEEHLFSAEMEENMKKSIARYLDNKLFSELRQAISMARDDVLGNPYPNYNLVNTVFSRIESRIPQVTT